MAASFLLGLDEERTLDAMGNAGTQAAGLWQFLASGAMSKHLHTGRAAEAGVVSAQLAGHGFTGARDILEGEQGFFAALAPAGKPRDLLAGPDAPWQIHQTSIKPWPSCRHTHPLADAAFAARANDVAMTDPAAIRDVRIHTYGAALAVCDRPHPVTDYQAKFSLQHVAAAVLTDNRLGFDSFDAVARARLAPLRRKITVIRDPVIDRAYPDQWGCRLQLLPVEGEPVVFSREHALGDPELPLEKDALIAKARELFAHGGMDEPDRMIDAVLAMAAGALPPPLSWLLP
jgi:2-methylcitrate dehydratase PrpD